MSDISANQVPSFDDLIPGEADEDVSFDDLIPTFDDLIPGRSKPALVGSGDRTDPVDPASPVPPPLRQALRTTRPEGMSAYEAYLRGGSLDPVTRQEIEALRRNPQEMERLRRVYQESVAQRTQFPLRTGGAFSAAMGDRPAPPAYPASMEVVQEVEPYEADAIRRLTPQFGQIKFGGLPVSAVARLGFGRNLEESARGLVGDLFGPEAAKTVTMVQPEGGLQAYPIFRRSPQDPYETIFDPRTATRAGAAASAIEAAPSVVAGTAGGIAGSFASPIIGTAFGTGVATALADFARLMEGQRTGIIPRDVPQSELFNEALKRGGLDAIVAGGSQALLGVLLRHSRGGIPDLGGALDEIQELIRTGQLRLRVAEQETGLAPGTLQTTTGALVGSNPRGAVLQEMEAQLGRTPGEAGVMLRAARDRIAEGKEALQSAPGVLGEGFETPTLMGMRMSPSQIGERMQRIAPGTASEVAESMVRMARARPANPQYGPAQVFIDPADPAAGRSIAGALEAAEEAAKARVSDTMVAVRNRVTPTAAGPASEAQSAAIDEEARGQLNRIAGLDQADQRLISQFLDDINNQGANYTYDQFRITLESLRRAIRKAAGAQQGQEAPNVVTLMRLEEALTRDRDALVLARAGQGAVDQINNAEASYRQIIDGFRRTELNKFLGTTSRGADIIGDASIGARILRSPESAMLVSNVVNARNFPLEREQIRSMLRFELAREGGFLAEVAGRRGAQRGIDEAKFASYLDTKRPILRQFFSDREIEGLRSIGQWSGRMRRVFGVDDLSNMGDWFNNFWAKGDARQAAELMNRLNRYDRNNPGDNIGDTVRAYMRNRLASEITDPPTRAGGMPMIDKDKLFKLLQDKPERIEWLNAVIDPGFANRMRVVEQALRQLEPPPSGVVLGETERAGRTMATQMQEAKVIVLGTLNRAAAFANRQINKAIPGAQRAYARAMVDPEYFNALVEAGRRTTGKTSVAQALAMGIDSLVGRGEIGSAAVSAAQGAGGSAMNMVMPTQQ